jgi:uncharacterized protein YdeI (YjbR/CyaY-like superfamily)
VNRNYEALEVPDREAWRAWLAAESASSPGVWLAVGKKGGHRTSLTYEEAVEEALCFGWIDGLVRSLDAERMSLRFTPRRKGGTWSASNKERVARLLAEGRIAASGLAAIETARADGSWDRLADSDKLIMPSDLASAMAGKRAARRVFDTLTASRKKMILSWVTSAKRSETRARRIAETLAALGEGRSPIG